jgi:hypothetical protein
MIALSVLMDIGAESRFFLQVLTCKASGSLDAPYKIKPVAKALCLTERFVRDASRELVKAGLLRECKQEGGIGRPGVGYLASEYLLNVLREVGSEFTHQELILRLFTEPDIYAVGDGAMELSTDSAVKTSRAAIRKDGQPAAPGAKGRLGAATRILLAAFLSKADQCGVVTGLGESRLRSMTGLDSISIKHQLKRLISLGFVRSFVPGLSNGVFVGSKVTSIYYLNLDHPQLRIKQRERGLVVYATQGPAKTDMLEAAMPSTEALKALMAEPGQKHRALDMLYHKLASHTSSLLTTIWADPECELADVKAALFERIASELGGPMTVSPDQGVYGPWDGLKESFHAEVCRWAESIHKGLRRMKVWQGYKPQLVRLIPAPGSSDNFSIVSLVVYPAPRTSSICIWVWDIRGGRIDSYVREDALDLALRYEVALLTKAT